MLFRSMASLQYGNFGKLLVFALGGDAELPQPTALDRAIPEQPELASTADDVRLGEEAYHMNCAVCHGFMVKSSGVVSDLRLMNPDNHKIFKEIVLDGIYAERGMAGFADLIDEADVKRIQAYVVSRANEDRAAAAAATTEGE